MTAERYISTLELDASAEATPWARRHVRDVLSAWQVTVEHIDTAELAVCELVSNAVQHVAPDAPDARVTLTLRHDESQLIAEVSDPSDHPPVPSTATSKDAESGRGLFIVGEISKEWDYYLLPTGGKVVWCVIALG
ncbi:ATP-binding protein [Actinacidiphila acididurans]|uniref:ATP-binding protein n=1 Tax=Actinacidiphila acididurans TaxID=2784346 RepID=A0ABS2TT23_9ACTN|nr:ATP-binding protein [Actinacidiphila acididurans]MBM9506492.1 ATP-binding protein [Actinacidiphila acididurans]